LVAAVATTVGVSAFVVTVVVDDVVVPAVFVATTTT
jgi:hypothetical protein